MYLPRDFAADDPELAWSVVEEHPFGMLIDPSGPSATHMPFLVARSGTCPDRLRGHVARRNPVAERLEGSRLMALFKGPDAYVSPLWYEHPCEQVPTWNYVVAHAMGHGKILSKTETLVLLDDLCSRFEGPTGFRPNWLDPLLLKDLVNEIVAFDIVVDYLQAKFKLSQNRSAADRNRVAQGLTERNDGTDLAIVEWMRRVPG